MGSEEDHEREMFVSIRWKWRPLAVPLAQLEGLQVDEESDQAIQDWRYWVTQGYAL